MVGVFGVVISVVKRGAEVAFSVCKTEGNDRPGSIRFWRCGIHKLFTIPDVVVFREIYKVHTLEKPSPEAVFRRSVTRPWGPKKIQGSVTSGGFGENLKKFIKKPEISGNTGHGIFGTRSFGEG
jgi:hypothetical protein